MEYRAKRLSGIILALTFLLHVSTDATAETNITRLVVLFGPSKVALDAAALKEVAAFARLLKRHPQLTKIEVQGHCDTGEAKTKRLRIRLSSGRAETVRKRLIALGIAPRRLVTQGYGAQRPVGINDAAESRARNRRVSLKILDIGSRDVKESPKRKSRRPRP